MKRNLGNCADDGMKDAKVYRKTTPIRAVQMNRSFVVKTPHGLVKGRSGDYMCENMEGTDRWPVKKEIFERTHEAFPCQEPIDETKRPTRESS